LHFSFPVTAAAADDKKEWLSIRGRMSVVRISYSL